MKPLNKLKHNISFLVNELSTYPDFISLRKRNHTIIFIIMIMANLILLGDHLYWHLMPISDSLTSLNGLLVVGVVELAVFMLLFVISTSFCIIYCILSRYAMNTRHVDVTEEQGKTSFGFDEYFQTSNLIAVLYDEKGLLKWNQAFEDAYGSDPMKSEDLSFETFISSAPLYYGEHQYRDIQFHYQQEFVIKRQDGRVVPLIGEISEFDNFKRFMAFDTTYKQENDRKLEKYLGLKDALIEINQAVIGIKDIQELLELIVEKAVKLIPNATSGTALKLESDGYMRVISSYGFSTKDVEQFSLKVNESFLFTQTAGRLDETVLIDSGNERGMEFSIKYTSESHEINGLMRMRATISSPLLINGEFFGSLNIDTFKEQGFNNDDIETVDYIRRQVEVALSKHRLYEDTIYLSRFDELTGVYNRRYFETKLNHLIEAGQPFCLVLFDTSHLRTVNDTYGHAVGDAYIGKFASVLTGYFEDKALVGRYGGDEFIAAFPDVDCNNLITRIEVLNILFSKDPMMMSGNANVYCQFRYGISEYPHDADQLEDLVSLADRNLRSSKER